MATLKMSLLGKKEESCTAFPPQNDHGIVHLSCMLVSAIWTSKIFFHLAQVVCIVADSVVESTATIIFTILYTKIIDHPNTRECITGCAVAQHCYNGDVSFLWEKWKL